MAIGLVADLDAVFGQLLFDEIEGGAPDADSAGRHDRPRGIEGRHHTLEAGAAFLPELKN